MPGPKKFTNKWRHTSTFILASLAFALIPRAGLAANLLDTYQQALKNDPTFLAARANYMAEQQKTGEARAVLLPNINASANATWNDSTNNLSGQKTYNSNGYSVSLSQPVFNFGAFAALAQAHASVRAAAANFNAAREDLMRRVAEAYFGLLLAQDNLGLAKSQQAAIAQQREVAQGRLKVGLGTITEVHDAEARYQLAAAQVLEAQNGLEDARQALREVAGTVPKEVLSLREDMPLPQPDPPVIGEWVTRALDQNYQVIAAREANTIAKREISKQHAGYYPSLDIVGSYNYSDSYSGFTGTAFNTRGTSVGLQLSMPIFQGGLTHKLSKEAAYRYNAARQNLILARRQVERQTRDAFLGITSGASRVNALKQAVIASQSALEAKQTGFEAGINTNLEVLDAQRDLYQARRDYAQSRYNFVFSLLRLKQAAGTLAESDLKQINGWLQ
jgi:outer membrane protein